jgi:hypothetical protein
VHIAMEIQAYIEEVFLLKFESDSFTELYQFVARAWKQLGW